MLSHVLFRCRGAARRERLQQESAAHRAPAAPRNPRAAPLGLADVRLGSLDLALDRHGNFAEWMRKKSA